MPGLKELQAKIDEYCERYKITLKAKLSEPYDLATQWQTDSFPNAGKPGCYFIFNAEDEVLYIGKASLRSTVGRRLATYFYWDKEADAIAHCHGGWTEEPTKLRTIAVQKAFEAASLEEFLIAELQPSQNTSGIKS